MKKSLVMMAGAATLVLSSQTFAASDMDIWVGSKIYDRAFGRGCATCHDIATNPNLIKNIKDGSLSYDRFKATVINGKNAMPKAGAAMDTVGKKKGYTGDKAIKAVFDYLKAGGGKIKKPKI